MRSRYHGGIILSLLLTLTGPAGAQKPEELAVQARQVLKDYCHRCHQGPGSESGYDFDVLKIETMTAKPESGGEPYLTAKNLEQSYLWTEIERGSMPRRRSPERDRWNGEVKDLDQQGQKQKEILKKWIEAGLPPFPNEDAREFISLATELKTIYDHLRKTDDKVRPHLRYFTLTHLHNNPNVSLDQLRLTRAALSKTLNSLSWDQRVTLPRLVNKEGTILAIDMRKLLWTPRHWKAVVRAYPYGLSYDSHPDEQLKRFDADIRRLTDNREELLAVRADWFVATATRPPLYHQLLYDLYLPELQKRKDDPKDPANPKRMLAKDLEDFLNVDVIGNFLASQPTARRAGFPKSGVSGHNRLIERHPLKAAGAYWKSYDFKASTWEANLQQFPLGPRFEGNPFNKSAFKHDGGEIIFHLPNGLQGYLLIDGEDIRIDAGPIEVVNDALKTSGTPVIVNGLSCMSCHQHGMISPPRDVVRDGSGVFGKLRDKVRDLYPTQEEMNGLIARDEKQFLGALEEAVGPFLRDGANKDRPLKEFPEPVGEVARTYLNDDLDVAMVASELYLQDAKKLQPLIDQSAEARLLGLGALAQDGGLIKRSGWEARRGSSQMQQAARKLLGYSTLIPLD